MSIELDPTELGFERPFNREVSQMLHIRNPNYFPVAFKVKTTAPKQYCVRPNSGRIEVGKEVEVQVLLQAMKEDPAPDYRCRDKFLVQSVPITADKEFGNVQQIWSHVEKNERPLIEEKKIRVVFLQPGELPVPNGGTLFGAHQSPPPYTDPVSPHEDTSPTNQPAELVPRPEPKHTDFNAPNQNRSGGDLNPQLADARATIKSLEATVAMLREQIKELNARQRKSALLSPESGEGTAAMNLAIHPPEGVSVRICFGLCLFSFFLAYLCF